jgi:Flp pilus assembly protein TadB
VSAVLAGLAGALIVGGVLLAAVGARRRPVPPARSSKPPLRRRSRRISARTGLLTGLGVLLGTAIALATGWVIAIVAVPVAMAGLPALLAPPATTHIARLEAMEEWTRSLSGVLDVGVGLEQALIVTLRSAPRPIQREVSTMVGRLNARWPTDEALRAFADDLDDATGDLIAAKLVLASHRRGPGLAGVLESLAESVAADVRARRQVEADRDKPRATVRWITVITVLALVVLGLNTTYIEPYSSALGQVLLALLLGVDVACLVWMRLMTRSERPPRFIGRSLARPTVGGP